MPPATRPPGGEPLDPPRPRGHRRDRRRRDDRADAVYDVLVGGGPSIEFQPLLSLTRLELAGYEALARFPEPSEAERRRTGRPVDTEAWLATGQAVGLGVQVEAAALARALALGADRPAGTLLAVNLSPSSLGTPELKAVLPDDLTGVEIELTEHEAVPDARRLRRQVDALRERGALIAVDDVGAGYAGLRRVLDIAPDTVKLDRYLVEQIADHPAAVALVRAVVDLAEQIDARVCAEGVESAADLVALAELDVSRAQGWFVGRPERVPGDVAADAVTACRAALDRSYREPGAGAVPGPAVGGVVAAVGDVRDRAGLTALLAGAAPALGCSAVTLHPLAAGNGVAQLSDPQVRARLRSGEAVPLREPADGPGGVLLVPVRSGGDPVAVLACTVDTARGWTRRQLAGARTVAGAIGPVVGALPPATG